MGGGSRSVFVTLFFQKHGLDLSWSFHGNNSLEGGIEAEAILVLALGELITSAISLVSLVNSCYSWSKYYKALPCLWKKFTVQLSVITSSKDEAKPNHRDWLLSIFFFIININYPLCYIKLYNSIHLSTGLLDCCWFSHSNFYKPNQEQHQLYTILSFSHLAEGLKNLRRQNLVYSRC